MVFKAREVFIYLFIFMDCNRGPFRFGNGLLEDSFMEYEGCLS
jgi:hypothetical protein